MPQGHSEQKSRSSSSSHPAAKRRARGATRRGEDRSSTALQEYKDAKKEGRSVGAYWEGKVIKVSGGGRFIVENIDTKEEVVCHVSGHLSSRAAARVNSGVSFRVEVDKHVLVDGNIIRAVVRKLSALREVNEKENNSRNGYIITSKSKNKSKNETKRNRN